VVGLAGYASTHRSSQALIRLLLSIGILGAVAAVVLVAGQRARGEDGSAARPDGSNVRTPAEVAVSAATQSQTAGWVLANLPRTSRLLADVQLRDALVKQGFPANQVIDFNSGRANEHYDYVVAGPAGRARASTGTAGTVQAQAMSRSRSVAVFGSASDQVQIRQLLSPADAANPVDVSTRAEAGRQLLTNPNVETAPGVRTVLDAGDLDLRPATLVAALAASTTVRLLEAPQNAAEQRANAPVRTLRLAVDRSALTGVLASLSARYRPLSSHAAADGSELITWLPDVAPEPPVG
jgi:hypothetical protein